VRKAALEEEGEFSTALSAGGTNSVFKKKDMGGVIRDREEEEGPERSFSRQKSKHP